MKNIFKDDQGVAIISALLILMLLSFVAVISTNTVMTEKRLNRSDAIFKENFYLAESAALEGVQRLANQNTIQELSPNLTTAASVNFNILAGADATDPDSDYDNLDLNDDNVLDAADYAIKSETSALDPNTRRLVVFVRRLGTKDVTKDQRWLYYSYGITTANDSRTLVKMGYIKLFDPQ